MNVKCKCKSMSTVRHVSSQVSGVTKRLRCFAMTSLSHATYQGFPSHLKATAKKREKPHPGLEPRISTLGRSRLNHWANGAWDVCPCFGLTIIKSWMVQWLRCPPVTRETGVRFPVRELFAAHRKGGSIDVSMASEVYNMSY